MRWCVLVCWAAIGCGGSGGVRFDREVSVGELLDAWKTHAGEVRAWNTKVVAVTGQMGEMRQQPAGHYVVSLLSEQRAGDAITAIIDRPDAVPHDTPRLARIVVRGKLWAGDTTLTIDDASISRR